MSAVEAKLGFVSPAYHVEVRDALVARAEKAETEVARLRSAGQRLLDAIDDSEMVAMQEEMVLAYAMLQDALSAPRSISPPTEEPK